MEQSKPGDDLTESQKVYTESNFDLIDQYTESFRDGVLKLDSPEFQVIRNKVRLYTRHIAEKFSINQKDVCKFAFGYKERVHLINGIFTSRSDDHLYFLTDGHRIKIGRTNNSSRRINDLQICSPRKLQFIKVFHYRGDYERKIHEFFKSIRLNGEWFVDDGQIRFYIRLLFRNNPDLSNQALFYGEY